MKFEEKMKKNKNYEISHIVRSKVTQRYITRSKTHCSYISVWSRKRSRWLGKDCGCIRTDARPSARAYERPNVFERMHDPTVRDARLGPTRGSVVLGARHGRVCSLVVREARFGYSFVMHDSDGRAARLVVVHGLVGTCPRFGVATHGLVAHGLNFMGMIEPCGWFIGMFTCN